MKVLAYLSSLANNSRHRSRAAAWLSIVILVLFANMGHASEWQSVVNTSDGIQIFEKGTNSDGLIEFRGVGVVEAPLPLVATVLFDTNRRREWIAGLAESRILRWEGKDTFIEYDHIAMPILFSDRDFVSTVRMRSDRPGKDLVFHYQASDDPAAAPATGYIRGRVLNMTFNLSSIDNDRTKVDAEFLCDPKGWIPAWLVNFFLKDWPKDTFRNLRKEVLKPDISIDRRLSDLLQPETISLHDPLPLHAELAILPDIDHMAMPNRADWLVPMIETFLNTSMPQARTKGAESRD